jgi:hypothetical protein
VAGCTCFLGFFLGFLAGDDKEDPALIFDLRIVVSQLGVIDSRGFCRIFESLIICIHFWALQVFFKYNRVKIDQNVVKISDIGI